MSASSYGPYGRSGIRTKPSLVSAFLLGVLITSASAAPLPPSGILPPLNGDAGGSFNGSNVIRAISADGAPAPPGDTARAADASPDSLPEAFRSLPESDQ